MSARPEEHQRQHDDQPATLAATGATVRTINPMHDNRLYKLCCVLLKPHNYERVSGVVTPRMQRAFFFGRVECAIRVRISGSLNAQKWQMTYLCTSRPE